MRERPDPLENTRPSENTSGVGGSIAVLMRHCGRDRHVTAH
jgi:hypothetical protein